MSQNQQLFFAVNNGLHHPLNDLWLGYATWLGDGWVAFPLAVILLVLIDRKNWRRNLIVLVGAAVLGGIAVAIAKSIFDTARPLGALQDQIRAGSVHVNVMFDRLYGRSFPSGHTQTAFTVGTVIIYALWNARRLTTGLLLLTMTIATVIGLSRIYVGAHWPVDVLGGAAIGCATATLICWSDLRISQRRKPAERLLANDPAESHELCPEEAVSE